MSDVIDLGLVGGEAYLLPFEGDDLFEELRQNIPWTQRSNLMFGRYIKQPRLTAWYGDRGAYYHYSGVTDHPSPWCPLMSGIRGRVETLLGHSFNSALANYYRDGRDSIGFHSDNERELGKQPVIASVSYGSERTFIFSHKTGQLPDIEVDLKAGQLLLMMGDTQDNWFHGINKTKQKEGRINITFRNIQIRD